MTNNKINILAKKFAKKNKISLSSVEVAEFDNKIILASGDKMSIVKIAQSQGKDYGSMENEKREVINKMLQEIRNEIYNGGGGNFSANETFHAFSLIERAMINMLKTEHPLDISGVVLSRNYRNFSHELRHRLNAVGGPEYSVKMMYEIRAIMMEYSDDLQQINDTHDANVTANKNNKIEVKADTQMSDYDAVEIIEGEDSDQEEIIEAYQQLINSGTVWKLQGFYGRTAKNLIEDGHCFPPQ